MKKYLRKIVVGATKYVWCAGRTNCDGDGNSLLTIWRNKKKIHTELFHASENMTPSRVKEKIEKISKNK